MPTWLTEPQQHLWRQWMDLSHRLPAELTRQLQETAGLSTQDYAVLVLLTDQDEGRLRMSELADRLGWHRSRLSHHVRRMGERGLVEREDCPQDRRGTFVRLTGQGRATIVRAAPAHVDTVRRLFFTGMSAEEIAVLERVLARVLDRLPDAVSTGSTDGGGSTR